MICFRLALGKDLLSGLLVVMMHRKIRLQYGKHFLMRFVQRLQGLANPFSGCWQSVTFVVGKGYTNVKIMPPSSINLKTNCVTPKKILILLGCRLSVTSFASSAYVQIWSTLE